MPAPRRPVLLAGVAALVLVALMAAVIAARGLVDVLARDDAREDELTAWAEIPE